MDARVKPAHDGPEQVDHPSLGRIKETMASFNLARALAGLALLSLSSAAAIAADYPTRTVDLVVPYPAGGGVDTVGRVIAQKLTEELGQQVIVVNRPGAGAVIGVREVAR